jgi:probable selenium-dependent hydroxylase accessory protein YqeC
LALGPRELISLVGAGGKTTLMFALAGELRVRNSRVVTTTTTKIYPPAPEESPRLLLGGPEIFPSIKEELIRCGQITWASGRSAGNKLLGSSPADLAQLWVRGWADYLIVEADGSARRPIKAPNQNEPVVPPESTCFVSVFGLSALGQPLNSHWAFRPEIINRLTGIPPENPITAEGLAKLAAHPLGGLKGWNPGMRALVFLNQLDSRPDGHPLRHLAESILSKGRGRIERVILGQLKPKRRLIVIQW